MHKEGTVKLLNFAYLKVDQRQKLGAGSFSTVYTGMYKQTPVAIKVISAHLGIVLHDLGAYTIFCRCW